jgi:hypothetical protein
MTNTRPTHEQDPAVHDYVSYFGSLVDQHDTYAVVGINADGSYELMLDEGDGQTVRLHTVRRTSIQRTGGRTEAYRNRT